MAGYIGTTPVPQATQHRESFTATGGQTSFATAGYTPQFIDVYLNGVKLAPADYTATNGSDVVLASGATASDILEIVAYTPFEVANQTFTGDTSVTNLAVTGTFTSRGIDDNADAVAITIDSSENVGIGTSSPSALIHASGAAASGGAVEIRLEDTAASSNSRLMRTGSAYSYAGVGANETWLYHAGAGTINIGPDGAGAVKIVNNGSERMRIDSSGNLLVGKTSATASAVGVQVQPIGRVYATRDGDVPLVLRRNSSDGDILQFLKDGTTVGSIGANSGTRIYIGSGDANLTFNPVGNYVFPSTSTGGARDAQLDLGLSAARFKDLYLSGGIQFDSRSNKLDDYEEGSFTPTVYAHNGSMTATYITGNTYGRYTKIGQLVSFDLEVRTSTISGANNGFLRIGGLPFPSPSNFHQPVFALSIYRVAFDTNSIYTAEFASFSSTVLYIRESRNNNTSSEMPSSAWSATNPTLIRISGSYRTS